MSDELLHIKKKEQEILFDNLVKDEYDFCMESIDKNISRNHGHTVYKVEITKKQEIWDPEIGTYKVMEFLRNDGFEVMYAGGTKLIVLHPPKKVKYVKGKSKKDIRNVMKKELNYTQKYLYNKNILL